MARHIAVVVIGV